MRPVLLALLVGVTLSAQTTPVDLSSRWAWEMPGNITTDKRL